MPTMLSSNPQPITVSTESPFAVDLNPIFEKWNIPVRPQGSRPTCSVFTVVGALEYAFAHRRGTGEHLSVEFLNWAAHHATDRIADGGFFWELWEGYVNYGICPETSLPYAARFDADLQPPEAAFNGAAQARNVAKGLEWIKEWNPETGLTDPQFTEIKRTLAGHFPVCGGFRWPKDAIWVEGVLQMRSPSEVFDGHSVLLSGYRDDPAQPGGGVFAIRNSGSPNQHGHLSYEYVRTYMNDAAVVR